MTYSDYARQFIGVKQGSTKHKKILSVYNSIKPLPRGYKVKVSDNWCATFVSFVLYSCGCKHKVFECGAQRMFDKFKKSKKIVKDKTQGQVNDVIFYDWQGNNWIDHVGMISKVTKTTYTVIEGNKDHKVGERVIKKSSSTIAGIGRV